MSDEICNVIALEPRRKQAPALRFVEIRLDDAYCSLEMRVFDVEGNEVATMAYDLVHCEPAGFDLGLLRAAWEKWRGDSGVAS